MELLADRVGHLRQLRVAGRGARFRRLRAAAILAGEQRHPGTPPPTGFNALRTIAVSQIYIDNFNHLTARWVGLGVELAQVALRLGATV